MLRTSRTILSTTTRRRRYFSTTNSIENVRIVSRRSWNEYRAKNPAKKSKESFKKNKKKADDEEKPWPRSMQIAGYIAGCIAVPYSIAWYLSMNKEIRQLIFASSEEDDDSSSFSLSLMENALRSHFGIDDEENTSYEDLRNGIPPKSRFIDEESYSIRKQQGLIEKMIHEEKNIPVRIHIYNNNNNDEVNITNTTTEYTELPGDTSSQEIYIAKGGSNNNNVALDFDDLSPSSSSNNNDNLSSVDSNGNLEDAKFTYTPNKNNVYSSWHYHPSTPKGGQNTTNKMTTRDITISRLEHTVENLEKELKDIHSTRDIDDMRLELKHAKSELRSLKWKRRLGLS